MVDAAVELLGRRFMRLRNHGVRRQRLLIQLTRTVYVLIEISLVIVFCLRFGVHELPVGLVPLVALGAAAMVGTGTLLVALG